MKIILSNLLNQASGRIGNTVIQANAHGAFARSFVQPRNTLSTSKSKATSKFSLLSGYWNSLSNSDRSTWYSKSSQYSFNDRFGNAYTPNAYQLFQYINGNLLVVGSSWLQIAPDYYPVYSPIINYSDINLATPIAVLGFNTSMGGSFWLQVYCCKQAQPLTTGQLSQSRLINVSDWQDSSFYNAFPDYESVFGPTIDKSSSITFFCYYVDKVTGICSAASAITLTYEKV
jgi:hypothetical protein